VKKNLFFAFFFMISIAVQAQELTVKSKANPGLFGKLKALKISIVSQKTSTNLMGPKAKNMFAPRNKSIGRKSKRTKI